jgi:phenylacetate-coenzyme A ligase PaaK-like adenylate-forming protein
MNSELPQKVMTYDEILSIPPFSLDKIEKEILLTAKLKQLTERHYKKCSLYKNMLDGMGFNCENINSHYDIPFLPVSLFKELELVSVDKSEISTTMTSSGTTGQAVSKIFLDKQTAGNQQKTLVKIVSDFTGSARMPMLIIDSPSVIKDRAMFSARGAGILGFSIFGADRTYALDDEMRINLNAIEAFLDKHKGQKILMFGFTFMVWQHFCKELTKLDHHLDLSNGVLIHGGGWKKLISEAVSHDEFNLKLNQICGLSSIHDYYGMVEQTGCIYMECEYGHLHASIFSDVIARRYIDFSVCDTGETGIIQVVSMLPESYPGHSLLTEDEGIILGEDDCPCGRQGKYFKINGRLKNAEIRGCSDTYATKFR